MTKSGMLLLILAALIPTQAFAARLYHLEGNKWAIVCDDGTAFTFGGSAEGAAEVATILCPGGSRVEPGSGGWVITFSLLERFDRDRLTAVTAGGGRQTEVTGRVVTAAFRGYPPHGYPCLGCEPCPGNPTEFCSTTFAMQVHPAAARAGFVLAPGGRLARPREGGRMAAAPAPVATRISAERSALICANGAGYSVEGSDAAVDSVAPLLCEQPGTPFRQRAVQRMQEAERFVVWNERTRSWQRR